MSDGLASVTEAFDAAFAELGGATPGAEVDAQPATTKQPEAVIEQAEVSDIEQPEEPSALSEEELDALLLSESDDDDVVVTAPNPNDPQFWQQSVDIDGETVSLEEVRNGYLRQSDYTRKTQELAEQRKLIGDAAEAYERLTKDPEGFYMALGKRLGFINADTQVPDVEAIPRFMSDADIQAEVDKRLADQIEQHPEVQRARAVQANKMIDDAFAEIEREFDVRLKPEHRIAVMQRAVKANTGDLRLVYEALVGKRSNKVAAAAPPRTSGRAPAGVRGERPAPQQPMTVQEALAMAEEEWAAAAS